jgi:hypothetical protein
MMKNNKLIFWGLTALAALSSCEKDEIKTVAVQGSVPVLTVSQPALVLTNENAAKEAVQFSWTPVDYGYQSVVNYTIQLDKKGKNFQKPAEIAGGNLLKKALTTSELNSLLINKLKLTAGQLSVIEARVVSSLGASAQRMDAASAVSAMKVTPYFVVIVYPSIYVPGSHQGWAPDKAPRLVSVKDDKMYEGYVYFPDASNEFKFTNAPNWNEGDYGSAGPGKLGKGDNLKVAGAGYYLLKADLTALTWSSLKTIWGVIGSATKGGWDADQDMLFDPKDGAWKAELALKAGEIKFRANDDWAIAYGDGNADGIPDTADNNNIKIDADGTYIVTLNLGNAGNYSYSVTKK